jgi:hypothetical protein
MAQKQLVVVSRIDRTERREYLVAVNNGTAAETATVPTATPSSSWSVLSGSSAAVKSGADGRLSMSVPPLSALLLRADSTLPSRAAPKPALKVGLDPESGTLFAATATVATADPVSVTFAQRRGSGGWHRVASDDSPPYRAFLEPARYRKGEQVQVVAIVTATNGSVAVSKVVTATLHR